MARRTPLRSTAPLVRRAPLRYVSASRHRRGVHPRIRQAVLDRDGGCRAAGVIPHVCGGRLDPHHVWRQGQGGPNELWNLVTVCRVAHDWIHRNVADSIRLGFLSRASAGEVGAREAQRRRNRLA